MLWYDMTGHGMISTLEPTVYQIKALWHLTEDPRVRSFDNEVAESIPRPLGLGLIDRPGKPLRTTWAKEWDEEIHATLRTYIYVYIYNYIYAYIYIMTNLYVCLYVFICNCVCVYIYICIHMYIDAYTYM